MARERREKEGEGNKKKAEGEEINTVVASAKSLSQL